MVEVLAETRNPSHRTSIVMKKKNNAEAEIRSFSPFSHSFILSKSVCRRILQKIREQSTHLFSFLAAFVLNAQDIAEYTEHAIRICRVISRRQLRKLSSIWKLWISMYTSQLILLSPLTESSCVRHWVYILSTCRVKMRDKIYTVSYVF